MVNGNDVPVENILPKKGAAATHERQLNHHGLLSSGRKAGSEDYPRVDTTTYVAHRSDLRGHLLSVDRHLLAVRT